MGSKRNGKGQTMKKRLLGLFAAGAMAVGLMTLPASAFKLEGEPKVAMIIFSQKNDGGWSQALDEARQRLEASMGIKIPVVENVPENATAIRPAVELFIQRGFNVIIGSAFGYSDTFKELSEKYPNVAFLNPAGITNGPNLESFYGRTYESQYLCGMAAAGASKTGKLGFVAANPFGLVNWTVNAYALGAQQINPDATVTVVYTGAWNDPVKGSELTKAQISEGADVVYAAAGGTGVGVLQTAADEGILSIGVDSNQNYMHPGQVLTSMMKRVDNAVYDAFKEGAEMTTGINVMGLANDGVGYAMDDNNAPLVTDDMKAKVEEAAAKIKSGEIVVHDYMSDNTCPAATF